ncbi:Uncharacterised protein [Achromobacter sp. 2789STDY5608615]|nr:Uncharacterised protein [Achromobacter sp. 2789STDY5608615]
MHVHRVHAVAVEARAGAAAQRFQVDEVAGALAPAAREHDGRAAVVAGGHGLLRRQQAAERAEDGARDLLRGDRARAHRRRMLGVGDGAHRRRYADRVEQAGVGRQVRIQQRLDRVIHAGPQRVERQVHGAARLLARALEIEMQPVAADRQRHLDRHRIAAHAVVIQVAAEGVAALRQLADAVEQAAPGIGDDVIHRAQHGRQAHLPDQALHRGRAAAVGGHLHAQVQHPFLGVAGVGADQAQHVLVHLAGARDAAGGDADAFLEDRLQAAGDRAGHRAADVRMVGDVGGEKAQRAFPEHRRDDVDVGQVAAIGQIGVIADEHIAVADLVDQERAQYRAHGAVQRAQVQRDLRALRHQPAGGVEQRHRAVLAFLDVGRERGPHQRVVHVFGDRQQAVAEHLHADRVGQGHARVVTGLIGFMGFTHGSLLANG